VTGGSVLFPGKSESDIGKTVSFRRLESTP